MTKVLELPPEVQISTYPERQKGGQQVGWTSSGVKMVHEGYGVTVIVETERSQFKNREIAADAMLAALTHPMMRR